MKICGGTYLLMITTNNIMSSVPISVTVDVDTIETGKVILPLLYSTDTTGYKSDAEAVILNRPLVMTSIIYR